ncbi:MAG TPA: ATP-binding cassette domain-containing protein [Myxococcales bacterium]|nr:ATP-binding cassette domain-containing protein [Myxococcales bacterium]
MIEVQDLHKSFGPVKALRGVSFTARDGEITGLLGPNGAGKTTTLRILTTVLQADQGRTLVDGVDAAKEPLAVRARLGALPHAHGLYPRLTAREHVRYFGELHGLRGAELRRRTDELLEMLEMKDVADRRAEGFSQGQQLRVAIARALVHAPGNVLLDEPTAGLDVPGTRTMRRLIGKLKEEGRCVLFSSHVMQEVTALCDRVVVIAGGTVVADGTLDELRARTGRTDVEDAFVAAIGSGEGLK